VIPDEAIEAAHKAWREQAKQGGSIFEYNLRAALEAAAPFIAAVSDEDALRAAWDRGYATGQDGLAGRIAEVWDEGRKKAVEVLTVDNFGNPDLYKIGHMGKGFNVTALPTGATVQLAA